MFDVETGRWRHEEEETLVKYRERFEKLLASPKPLRDQLVIELPTLQAFRTGEVSSFRAEWVDFDKSTLSVLDSVKLQLFHIPLHPIVAQHVMAYMDEIGITKGILIQAFPDAHRKLHKAGTTTRGEGLSESHINRIWKKYCEQTGIPPMTPRWGRAFFAIEWITGRNLLDKDHLVKKNIYGLKAIMRHDKTPSTEHLLDFLFEVAK